MPGVLIMECLAQAAGIWLLSESGEPGAADVRLVGIDRAKFRRPVIPGDRLRLEVQIERRRGALVRASGRVTVANERVAEGRLLLHMGGPRGVGVHPTAQVHPSAVLGRGVQDRSLLGGGGRALRSALTRCSSRTSWSRGRRCSARTTTCSPTPRSAWNHRI